uniref:Putative LOC101895777 [Musca domestica] n=1 Tax=Lepeophtheirus salmonis TaxID=72036 RepID=A0A0K2T8S5_LEPSM
MAEHPSKLREDIVNKSFIHDILKEKYGNDIQFLSYSARVGSDIGDNYIGDLVAVDIQVKNVKTNEEKMFNWMFKVMKRGKCEKGMKQFSLFEREFAFYNNYLDDLDKYVKPKILRTVPLIYSVNNPDLQVLVFEHLGASGYRDPVDKKIGVDDDHVYNVCKWLAELHGSAFVLFQKYPGGFSEWKKNNFFAEPVQSDQFDEFGATLVNSYYNLLEDLLNGSENDLLVETFEKSLKDFFENTPEDVSIAVKIKKTLYESRSEFKTLCHGDAWFNNMLFKYNDDEKVNDVILLDMQGVYSGNIGSDLVYFLLSSVTCEDLTKNLDNYLEYYRECLCAFVTELDPDIKVPLSFEDIKMDFKKSAFIGFMFASGAFPHTIIEKSELSSLDLQNVDLTNPDDVNKMMVEIRDHGKKVIHSNLNLYYRLVGVIRFLTELRVFDYLKN